MWAWSVLGQGQGIYGGHQFAKWMGPGVSVWTVWPVWQGPKPGVVQVCAGLVSAILVTQPATEHVLGLKMYVACPNGAHLPPDAKILRFFSANLVAS